MLRWRVHRCTDDGFAISALAILSDFSPAQHHTSGRRSIFERQRDGVFPTPVGQMIVDYSNATLAERKHVFRLAREITLGAISPLRVGFSCFVNSRHLQTLRSLYKKHSHRASFSCQGAIRFMSCIEMERGDFDCALLLLPIEGPRWIIEQIASAPLVVCMRSDDTLTNRAELGLQRLPRGSLRSVILTHIHWLTLS